MSIIKSVQNWLIQYSGMHIKPLKEVLTDLTKDIPSSYALAPAGDSKTETDVAGNRNYTKNYVFYALESAMDEIDRQKNHDFLEDLTTWIEECNDNENYPKLPEGFVVEEISVSNCLLYDVSEDGNGIYQIQLQLVITKWRE